MSQADSKRQQIEQRKNQLIAKLENKTISRGEVEELRLYLEQEKKEASDNGNEALVFAIAILLGFLLKYLADEKMLSFDKILRFFSGKKKK